MVKIKKILVSANLFKILREYYKQNKPKEYILECQNGNTYFARSIEKLLK